MMIPRTFISYPILRFDSDPICLSQKGGSVVPPPLCFYGCLYLSSRRKLLSRTANSAAACSVCCRLACQNSCHTSAESDKACNHPVFLCRTTMDRASRTPAAVARERNPAAVLRSAGRLLRFGVSH